MVRVVHKWRKLEDRQQGGNFGSAKSAFSDRRRQIFRSVGIRSAEPSIFVRKSAKIGESARSGNRSVKPRFFGRNCHPDRQLFCHQHYTFLQLKFNEKLSKLQYLTATVNQKSQTEESTEESTGHYDRTNSSLLWLWQAETQFVFELDKRRTWNSEAEIYYTFPLSFDFSFL